MTCHIYARDLLVRAQQFPEWSRFRSAFRGEQPNPTPEKVQEVVNHFLRCCEACYPPQNEPYRFKPFFSKNQQRQVALYLQQKHPSKAIATIKKFIEGRLIDVQIKAKNLEERFIKQLGYQMSLLRLKNDSLNELVTFYESVNWGKSGNLYRFLDESLKESPTLTTLEAYIQNLIDDPDDVIKSIEGLISPLLKFSPLTNLRSYMGQCGDLLANVAIIYNKWGKAFFKSLNACIYLKGNRQEPLCRAQITLELCNAFLATSGKLLLTQFPDRDGPAA